MYPDRAQFVEPNFEPAYLEPGHAAALKERAAAAVAGLSACTACPRACGVDRARDVRGTCRIGRQVHVSAAFPHFGEEPCLRGTRGSGTIFFSGCNLRCVFCQNEDISQTVAGQVYDAWGLAGLMLALQEEGCHNINLVTPEHVVPQVLEGLAVAVDRGLRVPIVYNTSGYDSVEALRLFEGLVDVYMPDFKLWSPEACERYLGAADYSDCARAALREMHRQVGVLKFTPDGVACRGVLVRHLVMPGLLQESSAIFRFLAAELSPDTFVNIMGQYHPAHRVCDHCFPELERGVLPVEVQQAQHLARAAGLHRFD